MQHATESFPQGLKPTTIAAIDVRALQAAEKLVRAVGRGFIPGTKPIKSMVGFTGCGKTHRERQEVSGHDFSRAASAAIPTWASAPAGYFSGTVGADGPFPAA